MCLNIENIAHKSRSSLKLDQKLIFEGIQGWNDSLPPEKWAQLPGVVLWRSLVTGEDLVQGSELVFG